MPRPQPNPRLSQTQILFDSVPPSLRPQRVQTPLPPGLPEPFQRLFAAKDGDISPQRLSRSDRAKVAEVLVPARPVSAKHHVLPRNLRLRILRVSSWSSSGRRVGVLPLELYKALPKHPPNPWPRTPWGTAWKASRAWWKLTQLT